MVVNEGASKESTHLKALRCLASWFNIHTQNWVLLLNTCLVDDILTVVGNPQVAPRWVSVWIYVPSWDIELCNTSVLSIALIIKCSIKFMNSFGFNYLMAIPGVSLSIGKAVFFDIPEALLSMTSGFSSFTYKRAIPVICFYFLHHLVYCDKISFSSFFSVQV